MLRYNCSEIYLRASERNDIKTPWNTRAEKVIPTIKKNYENSHIYAHILFETQIYDMHEHFAGCSD